MKSKVKPHEILIKQLSYMKKQNRLVSVRSIARDTNLSPSFLNDVFNGKRPFPGARLTEIAKAMKMDTIAKENLREAIERELRLRNPVLSGTRPPIQSSERDLGLEGYEQIPQRAGQNLLSDWFNVAIMDLITCVNFSSDAKEIARRLEIKEADVKKAVALLSKEGLIRFEDGQWQKTSKLVRLPTRRSMLIIRRFHAQMIKLAYRKLLSPIVSDAEFQNRLMNGITFAANLENIEKAKAHLNKALYETAEILAEGDCTEVFQLNCQLFPLTKSAL